LFLKSIINSIFDIIFTFRIKFKITYLFLVLTGLLFTSCQTSFGEKYQRGNLEIYFTEDIGKDFVERTADYFEQHDLILQEKHSIQLTSSTLGSNEPQIILKMILNKNEKALSAEDSLNLMLLQEDMRDAVFYGANFRIAICNENFVELK
jgi:hypothetical protein